MKLSILVCTLPDRAKFLKNLSEIITKQIDGKPVEFLVDPRDKQIPTGTKRNDLIIAAKGQYVVFIDDDDEVTPNYVDLILDALKTNPDCVTFEGVMTTDGVFTAHFIHKLGERYEARNGKYYRFPNHINVIKKSIAQMVKFKSIWQQEDYQWALEINRRGLLKTGVHIPKQLYKYAYRTKK